MQHQLQSIGLSCESWKYIEEDIRRQNLHGTTSTDGAKRPVSGRNVQGAKRQRGEMSCHTDDEVTASTPYRLSCIMCLPLAPSGDCWTNAKQSVLYAFWLMGISAPNHCYTFDPMSQIFLANVCLFVISWCTNFPHGFSVYVFICKCERHGVGRWKGPKCIFFR